MSPHLSPAKLNLHPPTDRSPFVPDRPVTSSVVDKSTSAFRHPPGKQRTESALAKRNVHELPAKLVADAKQGKQREAKGNYAKECQSRQATPAKSSNAKSHQAKNKQR